MVLEKKVIMKSPLKTLFSTSEGLAFVAYLVMTIYGMISGDVSFEKGLIALGGGAAGWGGIRQWAKTREKEAAVDMGASAELEELRDELLEIVQEERASR